MKFILNLGRLVPKLHFYPCTIPHLNKSRFILESRFTEQTWVVYRHCLQAAEEGPTSFFISNLILSSMLPLPSQATFIFVKTREILSFVSLDVKTVDLARCKCGKYMANKHPKWDPGNDGINISLALEVHLSVDNPPDREASWLSPVSWCLSS